MGITKVAVMMGLVAWAWTAPCLAEPSAVHKTCKDCHESNKNMKIANIAEKCTSCHVSDANDHKVGESPANIPAGLPLDKNNRITCATCHDPHGRGAYPKLLRTSQANLCGACHAL